MEHVFVRLPNPASVQAFVHCLNKLDGEFELVSDGFILDARSLMGIFSLDLSQPLQLNIYENVPAAKKALAEFIVPGGEAAPRKEEENG